MEIFIAKFDSSGNFLWGRNSSDAGGVGSMYYYNFYNRSVACDKDGNCYISGHFYNDTIRFGNFFIADTIIGTNFITKYDSSGNVVWAKKCSFFDISKIIIPENSNDLYFTGENRDIPVIKFGNDSITVTLYGNYEILLGKIDSSGNFIWARTAVFCSRCTIREMPLVFVK